MYIQNWIINYYRSIEALEIPSFYHDLVTTGPPQQCRLSVAKLFVKLALQYWRSNRWKYIKYSLHIQIIHSRTYNPSFFKTVKDFNPLFPWVLLKGPCRPGSLSQLLAPETPRGRKQNLLLMVGTWKNVHRTIEWQNSHTIFLNLLEFNRPNRWVNPCRYN